MKSTAQARLDPESSKTLEHLVNRLGWSPSRVVREGIRLLAACYSRSGSPGIVGLGKFSSGVPDLGSNKSRLQGFGQWSPFCPAVASTAGASEAATSRSGF